MKQSFFIRFLAPGCVIAAMTLATRCAEAQLKGVWTDGDTTSSLVDFHVLGAATRLKNGQVVAAGGLNIKPPNFGATRVAELYDPTLRRWTLTGPLQTPRWSLDAVTLSNGKALFAGGASGFSANAALDTAELFDPDTGTFTFTLNSLSVARQGFGISTLNDGRVLITGGNEAGNNLGGTGTIAVDIYDPETNLFRPAASMKVGRALHAQVTLRDGRVVVIGGAEKTAEIYSPIDDSWSMSVGTLPTTLKDTKAFELFDGRVFIPGGQNTVDGLTTDASWFFDPVTTEFVAGPSMAGFNYAPSGPQVGCSDYSAFDLFPSGHKLHGRYILIAGGEHDPLTGPDIELHSAVIFDATQNRFHNVGPMPFVHDDHTESQLEINENGDPEFLLFGGNSAKGTSRFEFDIKSILPE